MPLSRPVKTERVRRPLGALLGLGALVVLGLVAAEIRVVYHERMQLTRHKVERELIAISQLQSASVADWREHRLTDAQALSDDALFAQAATAWLQAPTAPRQAQVQQRLRILLERARYVAVYLVDPEGDIRLTPHGEASGRVPPPELAALQRALAQSEPMALDPRRDPFFAFPFFGMMVPVYDGAQPVGAVWLVCDVRSTLLPILESWPLPSETAESSLVMRQHDEVLFLSPVRRVADSALNFRRPMALAEDPAVQAVLGTRGAYEGTDYRNQAVLAVASAVPDSDWLVVSKVDAAEALGETRVREMLALGLPVSLGLLVAGFVLAYWQRHAWRRERGLKQELQHNMRWLEGAQRAASIGYFALEMPAAQFVLSPMAKTIFGLQPGESLDLARWTALLHPADRESVVQAHLQMAQDPRPLRRQYRIQHPGQAQVRWLQVWAEVDSDELAQVRLIGTVQDITERKLIEDELASYRTLLEAKVRLDPLTQVANRRALDEHVLTEWHRAMRSQAPLALLMIDVDHFKAYNDHHGHVAGDRCLQQVAQAIASSVGRAGEMVARYGGEEFSVLLPDANLDHAWRVGERICQAVQALEVAHGHSPVSSCVTVSVGGVSLRPTFHGQVSDPGADGPNPATLQAIQAMFEQADAALYAAKQAGRNRVLVQEVAST